MVCRRRLQFDSLERYIEFIGNHLPQCGEYALTDFDLTRVHGDCAVTIHAQPVLELAIRLQTSRQFERRDHCLLWLPSNMQFPSAGNRMRSLMR